MEPMVWNQIKHLYEVEKLSIRQIAQKLQRARKTVARVIHNERVMRNYPDSILQPWLCRSPIKCFKIEIFHTEIEILESIFCERLNNERIIRRPTWCRDSKN